jgi:hypothetical protein
MVGLNKWCQLEQQAVPKAICSILQKGKLWKEDAARLMELLGGAEGKDGNLSKDQQYKHRLWDLKIHHSKAKDGSPKVFWPEGTPNAQVLTGTNGDKGKAKKGKGKAKTKKEEKPGGS